MKKITVWLVAALFFQPSVLLADDSAQTLELLQKMQDQISKMQETIDRQNARIQQLESSRMPVADEAMAPKITEVKSDSEKKEFKKSVEEAIPWLKGVKSSGDFRLRGESFHFYDKSTSAGATDRSRNRFRMRLRWGLEKELLEDWKAAFRLVTGSAADQTSQMNTFGNTGSYFQYKNFFIDRAYILYTPSALKDVGMLRQASFGGGKVENPFARYSTGIVWDGDVTPEGFYEKIDFRLLESGDTRLQFFGTLGQFFMNEDSVVDEDANLYAYQGVLNLSAKPFGIEKPAELSIGVSYYDYINWFQTVVTNTSGTSYLRTNTSALDDPRVLDIYPEIQFYAGSLPVTLWVNYVKNVGEIDPVRAAMDAAHADDEAWGLGFKLGKLAKKGSWEAQYGYYEIAPNAVVAAFSDSDFGGPAGVGFSNRQGHKWSLGYQLTDAVSLGWTSLVVKPMYAKTLSANSADETVLRTQLDANYKF